MYIDELPWERGRDPEQEWEREKFERTYARIGYHESGGDFDEQLGVPREVGTFLFRRVKKRLLDWIQPGEGHCILDVGCGAGYLLYLIQEKYREFGFMPSMAGLETSTVQLSYMARRMQEEGTLNAIAVHGNAEYLPFANESFDLVTCSEVLEHIRNPGRALSEMHRVLKPNGKVLLSTPSMTARNGWSAILAPFVTLVKAIRRYQPARPTAADDSYDVPWYPEEFRATIRSAGFQILDFEYNAIIPHYYFKFLPGRLVKPAILVFEFADRSLKFMLKPLAVHFVVRASKSDHLVAGGISEESRH